ncbi:MAG: hypothetical protein ACI9WS_003045 [Paraglaciecola psychrophila]|jgi:hypothetical protein
MVGNSDEIDQIKKRNWARECFDDGGILEHTASTAIRIPSLALLVISGWGQQSLQLAMKLTIVVLIFLPIEHFDY